MKSMNIERRRWQREQDETETSSSDNCSSIIFRRYSYLSSSAENITCITLSCTNCSGNGCRNCDYGYFISIKDYFRERRRELKKEKDRQKQPVFLFRPRKKNAKSLRTKEISKKTVTKSTRKLLKDYCPYSSDTCDCSSGCTDCDYGLFTYTIKNKRKLKSKSKKRHVKSSNDFRPLKTSERSRRTVKSFNIEVLRKKRAKSPKIEKVLESCYPDSSDSCDYESDCIKCNPELYTTKKRIPKKTLAKNLTTTRIIRSLRLFRKKVSKNAKVAKVSERDVTKNWFPDSSNSCGCNSGCTDCGKKYTAINRKKLKHRSERARASTNLSVLKLSSVIDETF